MTEQHRQPTMSSRLLQDAARLLERGKERSAISKIDIGVRNLNAVEDAQEALRVLEPLTSSSRASRRAERLTGEARWQLARLLHRDQAELLQNRLCRFWLLNRNGSEKESSIPAEPLSFRSSQEFIRRPFQAWSRPLLDGFERGKSALHDGEIALLRESRRDIERSLKALAAELMTAGTEVRGISDDAIPLIAFGLVEGQLPLVAGADSRLAQERANDAVISKADFAASLHPDDRAVFISLLRSAFLLGVAQVYGEQLALAQIRTDV